MLRFALMLSLVLLTVAGIAAAGVWAALVALGAISASAGVRGLALVILVAGAGCLVLIVRTTRRRFAPIAALIGAAEQIERGDYSARVPERGGRDVRALARTFNTMSERLSAVDSQRRSFLADVAHELRTPLAIMRGRLEAMLDGIHPRDDDHLRAVLGHAAALERLVGDVATVAAAEAGALPLKLQQIDLAVLANSVADDFAETARETGAEIRVQVDSDAATVERRRRSPATGALEPRRKCAALRRAYCRRDRRRPQRGGHRDLGARRRRGHRSGPPPARLRPLRAGPGLRRAAGSVWRSWPISRQRMEARRQP